MAKGKDRSAPLGGGGAGPPPTAASSAISRRITRATSGGPPAGNLRAPEAPAGNLRAPGSAAAAAVGKQTELSLGAAAAPVSAAAAAGLSKEEKGFVNKFLYRVNHKPSELHKLYAKDAELDWNFDGRRIILKSNKTIKNFLSGAVPQRKFNAIDCKVQAIVNLNSDLLTVYGICDATDLKPRIFVQSFVLERPDLLILNDTLTVLLLEVPTMDISKKPQRHISNNRCGVCNENWHSADPKSWVQCGNCLTWLHTECDPLCCDDLEVLKNSNYLCPDCLSQFQSVLAVEHTSTGNFSERIPVSCLAKDGLYKDGLYIPELNKVLCECKDCPKEAKPMSMTAWESHSGSQKKKWKLSVYLKGTNDLLFDFLQKNLGGSVKLSTSTAELNPSSSVKSATTCAETCDDPAVRCSRTMNNKELTFCILHDCDGMRWHQDNDKDDYWEKASRIFLIMKKLKEDGVLNRTASEPFGMANYRLVRAVHSDVNYVAFINSLPMSQEEMKLKFGQFVGRDLFSSMGTPEAVYLAAGAFIRACELVVGGCYDQAFAVVRPPGHHADKAFAEGFCYYNNVAIGTQHVIDHFGVERALVVDFDVHHGNGTQEIFYGSNQVLFFSCHSKDLGYPESRMSESFIGEGDGAGYNINFPYNAGFKDDDFIYAVKEVLVPVANRFKPQVVIVSAGYDAGIEDMGGCKITSKCFGTIARMLLPLAGGKMVLALEGGYNLKHLPVHVSHTIRAILGDEDAFYPDPDHTHNRPRTKTITTADTIKKKLRPYWSISVEKPPGPTPGGEAPRTGGIGGDLNGAPAPNVASGPMPGGEAPCTGGVSGDLNGAPAPNVASGRNDPAPEDALS